MGQRAKSPKYYVVWAGRRTGIFESWAACERQVKGYPGARYKAFPTRSEAQVALQAGRPPAQDSPSPQATPVKIATEASGRPIAESYAVDASCRGNPGPLEYRGVHTGTRAPWFSKGPFPQGTNNIGEFLAIVQGLALLAEQGETLPLYSDSKIAMGWVAAGRCRTQLKPTARNAPLFDEIRWAETWLAQHPQRTPMLKWQTAVWGQIPADYDRK
ncbi:MAG: ribonuclease H family protein [Gloeomargaritaceae cyanobacterium C42_A2020_066]|nr:ribonuclease H family protein [Gloeomargaritaceae cyanobacterium C42_A2020_066]